jgi:hypothetical protein
MAPIVLLYITTLLGGMAIVGVETFGDMMELHIGMVQAVIHIVMQLFISNETYS